MLKKVLLLLGLLSVVASAQPAGSVDSIVDGDFTGPIGAQIGGAWTNTATFPTSSAEYGFDGVQTTGALRGAGVGNEATIFQTVNIGAGLSQVIVDLESAAAGTLDFVLSGGGLGAPVTLLSIPAGTPNGTISSVVFNVPTQAMYTFTVVQVGPSGLWEFDNLAFFAQPLAASGVPEIDSGAAALPLAILVCLGLVLIDRRRVAAGSLAA